MTVGSFLKGDAGDSFSQQNGIRFSTKDQDNDISPSSCAQKFNGAWWYRDCHNSNLNGGYVRGHHPTMEAQEMNGVTFRGYPYSLKTTEMKIRPVWFKP